MNDLQIAYFPAPTMSQAVRCTKRCWRKSDEAITWAGMLVALSLPYAAAVVTSVVSAVPSFAWRAAPAVVPATATSEARTTRSAQAA